MLKNLFSDLPVDETQEAFDDLLNVPGLRIERIVSHGQASPPGFWYQQAWDEWVLVMQGEAQLQIEGEGEPRMLAKGGSCWLPAGCRHRVVATSQTESTIWLAVHRSLAD